MFVDVRYDRTDGWVINENDVLQIPELREVLLDKSLGALAIAYIALGVDPDSYLAPVFDDENSRLQEAAKCVYEKDTKRATEIMYTNKVIDAVNKYRQLSETPTVRLRKQFQKGMQKLGDFIDRSGDALNEESMDNYLKVLDKMPKLIGSFNDMNAGKKEDTEEAKARVKGKKELSAHSEKWKNKNKRK